MHIPTSRLKRMDGHTYSRLLLKSKFCLCPVGDFASPGQRFFDAIAAGCVPIVVGADSRAMPFVRQIDYSRFAGFISRLSFYKDPVYAVEAMLHKLQPNLHAMQRALLDARHLLIYGTLKSAALAYNGFGNLSSAERATHGGVATLVLRELALAVAFGT